MCIWDSLQASPVPLSLNLPCPHPPHNNVPTPLPSLHPDNDATLQSHPHPCLHPCHHQPPPHCHCYLTSPLPSSLHCSCHHLSVIITLTFIFVLFVAIIISLLSSLPCHLFCPHHSHLYFCLGCCCHYLITGITAAPSCLHPHCPCPCVLLTSPCLSPRDQHGTSNPPWSWVGVQVQVGL